MKGRLEMVGVLGLAVALVGCPKDKTADEPMTAAEAKEAVDESSVESQASALTASSVEISTNFTIGKAVKEAAAELQSFIQSQLPCAEITLADATLTITYGAKSGNCVYRGQTFSGQHVVKVTKNDQVVEVDHEWKALSNGKVKVDGRAHVEWDLDAKERRVNHDLTWTRLSDNRTGRGTGDRVQKPLAGGVAEGIQIDGSRTWTGQGGRWDLAIQGVQMRWVDPVPQAGTYRLASPKGRSLELSFRRVDADTIEVTLKSGDRSFRFNVNGIGAATEQG